MRPGILFLVLWAVLGAVGAGPAAAQPGRQPGVLPLDRILPGIRREYPGDFYDADGPTPGPDGDQHYHLKWMTPDGRIMWLDTDARTGRVLGQAPGRDSFDGPRPGRNFAPAPSYPIPGRGERGFDRRELGGPGEGARGGGREAEPWRGEGRGGNGGGRRRDR